MEDNRATITKKFWSLILQLFFAVVWEPLRWLPGMAIVLITQRQEISALGPLPEPLPPAEGCVGGHSWDSKLLKEI